MKIQKKVKAGCALALAAAMLLTGLGLGKIQAASQIETDRDCSLTISVEIGGTEGGNDPYLLDFNQMAIPVSVYKVAEVDSQGQKFTPIEPFGELDFTKVGQETAAADWQALAEAAAAVLEEKQPEAAGSVEVRREEGSAGAAGGKIEGLKPGMYLVVPEGLDNPDHSLHYTFAPYLTALPGTVQGPEGSEWNYDTVIGLKPDIEPLYGKLHITKNLLDYNDTLGRATFVFQIVGVDQDGVVRYEEVESIDFNAPGSKTLTLEKIPAGLTVTVTEVYSGASYQVVGEDEQIAVIVSQEAVSLGGKEEASVAFTNRYDGGNRVGYGVTNRFESDGEGGWIWENPTASGNE